MTHEFEGTKYAIASPHQREWGTRLIAELNLKGDESILDLGCGDGTLSAQLAQLVPGGSVIGLDASRGMLDVARQKSARNLSFLHQEIDHLDFDQQFDVVFSNAALHWVKDHHRLYANVLRALRPHGRIRFNFAGAGNCSNFFSVIRHAMAMEEFAGYFSDFDWPWYMPELDAYRTLIDDAGLHHAELWSENADRYFPDADSLIRWIDQPSLVPFLDHLPDHARTPFREFVVGRMSVLTRHHDGNYFETFRRINLSAVI
jgi:trans-aconitate 2-methyltransferase